MIMLKNIENMMRLGSTKLELKGNDAVIAIFGCQVIN